MIKVKQKCTPNDWHVQRELAHYVEPVSKGEWNRPADISAIVAWEFLSQAINEYSRQYRFITPMDASLKVLPLKLYSAREQWLIVRCVSPRQS